MPGAGNRAWGTRTPGREAECDAALSEAWEEATMSASLRFEGTNREFRAYLVALRRCSEGELARGRSGSLIEIHHLASPPPLPWVNVGPFGVDGEQGFLDEEADL